MIPDMTEIANKLYFTKGYEAGVEAERERISKMAQARICFDFQGSGKCDHSVCYGIAELVKTIAKAQDAD
jgi:hypothetical protein